MKIKEVENRVGMTRANIRYYEQEGLLNPAFRNENNYREYSEEDVEQLQRIKILRLLGVSPADIKLLNGNAISMEALMQKRIKELEKEAKEIQDIHRICETIIDKKIDVHSLNENILTGDQAAWLVRMEELLKMDMVEEIVEKKQVNTTIAGILSWGYILATAVFMAIVSAGDMISLLGFDSVETGKSINSLRFWGIGAVLFVSFFLIHYTANVIAHVIASHVSALLLAPFAFGIAYIYRDMLTLGKPLASIDLPEAAGIGILLLGYVLVSYILSIRWNKMFTSVKYTLIVAAGYTAITTPFIWGLYEEWIMVIIVLLYLTIMIGVKWMIAVSDRKTYNRYYAIRHAGSILNFVGLNVMVVGYDNKS